ncbi:unconventional myosin-Vb isoform X2 [Brienomyrus brachyistius]|uniref:unconventional myosin-Vb isoform X2 n=1 Tax=Brienomyrus brachyistius TaxID=42636 RepID=UPI0020B19741|nr:unconventional myosin-Vb isoform X2 [Brienomyrus brachyistius]
MAATDLYTKGTCVWLPDPDEVWISGQLLQDLKLEDRYLLLQLSDGREARHPVASPSDLPPLGNPEILQGENDLTCLSFLHEPAVLHNLRVRFLDYNDIYTYCGIVLVAINPYEQLPIYGEEVIDAYSGQDIADMEPHIFSVAEEAYRAMIREKKNQSIIISGESGSGKTVSAKFTMRYFAVVGGAAQQTSVEEKVLASNPIMEAFGNAKTTRNDNSSRFGKYTEIGFGNHGDIIGANMRTYLLEKSRVVFQAQEERNYHIFYQLCAARDLPEMKALKLEAAECFRYTNQGGSTQIPGTDDLADLERVRNTLVVLGIRSDQQMELFRILSAILHLGNISIQASGRGADRSYINAEDPSLLVFCKLLGVERAQMAHWLCNRRLAVGGEMLMKPMSGQQAADARDSLAKHVYGQLFSWTVSRLNVALRAKKEKPDSFIGVLDIYGFETFAWNSFEQFCINYANEKLQQQFNLHVFQLEQEEYEKEGLPWSRIEFSDNQPCITLIEGPLGLLDLLDEECRIPKGSDENWAQKLYDQHQNHSPHFGKPRLSNSAFIIFHFADMVRYECDGFLEKNRDTIFEEPINILRASQSELVAELFLKEPAGGALSSSALKASIPNGSLHSEKRAHREHKQTVGFQFRQSLQLLMVTLNSTNPHYVRCIKPNDLKEPFAFDPKRAVQQLRACGVLETIRISAAGFPSRWTYLEFFSRYRLLFHGTVDQEELRASCQQALAALIPDPDQYCFGKTKVFFRTGQVALLERLRAERLREAGVTIQSRVRGWLARRHYQRTRWASLTLQRYARGGLARRLARTLRRSHAALVIQKTFRMVAVRRLYLLIREATITIQAFIRGTLARRHYWMLVALRASVVLQAGVRGWLARRAYRRTLAAVLLLQCCVRRRAARRELLKLRAEARSVERYRELNKGMEVKLMQLQLRADQQARETAVLRDALHAERESHSLEQARLQRGLLKLEAQLREQPPKSLAESLRDEEERRRAEERRAQEVSRLTQEVQSLQAEKQALEDKQAALCSRLLDQEALQDDRVARCVAEASEGLRGELEEERGRYQGLLKEFTRLEQRYENLREMSALAERSRGCQRSDSSQSLVVELPSPLSSSLSCSPTFPVAEFEQRVSVTSPSCERRPWSHDPSLDTLMGTVEVPKDAAERIQGEDLKLAYDAVRVANKFLEAQLISQRSQWQEELSALRQRREGPRQTLVPPVGPFPTELQDFISAVLSENAELAEQVDAGQRECRRLGRELGHLRHISTLRKALMTTASAADLPFGQEVHPPRWREQEVMGLLECRKRDEGKLIRNLITDLRVDCALSLPPGLPASVLFLCLQQADYAGDQARASSLCTAAINAMKGALKKHSADVDMTALWLKNSCLLGDLICQHCTHHVSLLPAGRSVPGDKLPLTCTLSEQQRLLSDLSIQTYQQLLSITEARLQPMIVPAILESEMIPSLAASGGKPVGSRKRAGSDSKSGTAEPITMATVLRELGALYAALSRQALPPTLLEQTFRQLLHLLAATAFNNLLLRKDMCCWSRGMQIRYNVSLLEEWLRSKGLQTGGAMASLEPLIQAVQLLQVSKRSDADAQALVQTCTALSSQQIVKILMLYTPHSDIEERVTLNFIRTVQGLLKERLDSQPRQLLLDVRRVFPVTFPHSPSPLLRADQLTIPDSLKISFLRRV